MRLAKPAIDVGLATNRLDEHLALFEQHGLNYDHLLKVGGGIHQHRHTTGESVIKLNSHRAELASTPTGYSRLRLATDIDAPVDTVTVDGVKIGWVPRGHDGITGVEVTWTTADLDRAATLLVGGLGAEAIDGRYLIGESWVVLEHDPNQPASGPFSSLGLRYITVQVFDVLAEHARMLELGFEEGRAPVRLGDTAFISFVLDGDGNWIELSQRASLTGELPEVGGGRLDL